jgi:hypothetical protein
VETPLDKLYWLLYTTNQIADFFPSDRENGDTNDPEGWVGTELLNMAATISTPRSKSDLENNDCVGDICIGGTGGDYDNNHLDNDLGVIRKYSYLRGIRAIAGLYKLFEQTVGTQPIVTVKIENVNELDDHDYVCAPICVETSDADFYSKVTIDGLVARNEGDAMTGETINPDWVYGRAVHANAPAIPIEIEIWDEDDFSDDDQSNITRGPGRTLGITLFPTACLTGVLAFVNSEGGGGLCDESYKTNVSGNSSDDGDGIAKVTYSISMFYNSPPTANARGPYTVGEDRSVRLDAFGSRDSEQSWRSLTYEWDFDNDGFYDDATGINPVFSALGLDGPSSHPVGLRVTDNGGQTSTDTATVNVEESFGPEINFTETIRGTLEGSSIDAVGGFTHSKLGLPTASFSGTAVWSDGVSTPLRINHTNGIYRTTRNFPDDPTGTESDRFNVVMTIEDDDQQSDSWASNYVTVSNAAPKITSISAPVHEGQSVNVTGTFSDPALGVPTEIFSGSAVWSDGESTPLTINNDGTFQTTRNFADDDPTADPLEDFNVFITIEDDDEGSDSAWSADVLDVVAYANDAGSVGTQAFGGALGHDFVVDQTIEVTHLGVFDSGSDGLKQLLVAELWARDGNTGTRLSRLGFQPGDPGTLVGGDRFKPLDEPLTLPPGEYTIVAWGYNENEPNGNNQTGGPLPDEKTTADGDGAIRFVGTSRFSLDDVILPNTPFPETPDGGPVNRYSAGTFRFSVPQPHFAEATHEDAGIFNLDVAAASAVADIVAGDALSLSSLRRISGRDLDFSQEGNSLVFDTNQFNDLARGESETIVFGFAIDDNNGESNNTITGEFRITIQGRDEFQQPRRIDVGVAEVIVDEGETAFVSGFFSDGVTITASLGTVTQDAGKGGTWSWSFDTSVEPVESQTVTITATDDAGQSSTTTFDLVVNNLPPTISVDVAEVIVNEREIAINLGSFDDAGGAENVRMTASLGTVIWDSNSGIWSWVFHTSDGPGESQTVTITAIDRGGASNTTTFDLVVNNLPPNTPFIREINVVINEGDTALAEITAGDPGSDSVTVTASIGTLDFDGGSNWIWSLDTSVTPADTQTVIITVTDSDGAETTAEFPLVVNRTQIVSADLTGDGFVDFGDLTTLLANWGKKVSASEGNLVDPDSTVDFADLTKLLAAWTGSGGAASPQAAAVEATAWRDTATAESHIASDDHFDHFDHFDRLGRRDRASTRRANRANGLRPHESPLRRLQAIAVDEAMNEESTRDEERIIRRRAASGARR